MKVLTGDASAGGKVLTSGPDDKVFINFVDHGGVGLIAMPTGGYIYKDDLNKTLQAMVDKKMFSELVFYMEACESGSMFEDVLPDNVKIYATTAANGQESSWGTYCPPSDKVDGKSLNTCLGDLYSVNWMEDADQASTTESLDDQYDIVKNETTKSHVMKFGEPDMGTDKADGFWGKIAARATSTPKMSVAQKEMSAIDSRDVKLHTLYSMYLTSDAKDTFAKSKAAKALIEEIQSREMYDKLFNEIATRTMASNNGLADEAVNGYRKPTQHQCHRTVNEAFEAKCGRLSDYALKYVRVVVNLCEITKSPETIVAALEGLC